MKIEKIIGEGPTDERQQNVRDQAAWKAFLAILFGYLIIGLIYAFRGAQVPWSTEVLASLGIFVFAGYALEKESVSFRHPWLPDNNVTLAQAAIIRSAPWVLLLGGYLALIDGVVQSIYFYQRPTESGALTDIAGTLGFALLNFLLNIYFAKRMRLGKKGTIWLFKLLGVFAILLLIGLLGVLLLLVFVHDPVFQAEVRSGFSGNPVWMTGVSSVTAWWPIYVVWKYGKRMVEDGKSFNK